MAGGKQANKYDEAYGSNPKPLSEEEVRLELLAQVAWLNNCAMRAQTVRTKTALRAAATVIHRLASALYYGMH